MFPALRLHQKDAMELWRARTSLGWSRAAQQCVGTCALAILVASACHSNACADDAVSIEIVGDIAARCRLSALPATVDMGSLAKTGTQFIPFQVDCNAPFGFDVRSRDGGLKGEFVGTASGFTNIIPYTLEVRIPTDGGLIFEQCGSAALGSTTPSCGHGDSGNAVAIDETASLFVAWETSEEIVAGTYVDVLTVSVFPRF